MFGLSFHSSSSESLIAAKKRRRDAREPRLASFVTVTTSAMLVGLITLAAYTQVPQVTRAAGAIVPDGNYQQIEAMEGGIVRSVHVSDGKMVSVGDILVRLSNPDLEREAQVLRASISHLEQKVENATAIMAVLTSDTEFLPEDASRLVEQGLAQAAAQLNAYYSGQRAQSVSIEQQRQIIGVMEEAVNIASGRAQKQQDAFKRYIDLRNRGLRSATQIQKEEDAVDELRGEAAEAVVRLTQAQKALGDAIAARESETQILYSETLRQLIDDEAELVAKKEAIKSANARLERLQIFAPASGTIQAVTFANEGEVIEAGETVFELLPTKSTLQAEVRIQSLDIGHVDHSQSVALTVDTFDARRFGKVGGEIVSFSPVPLLDEQTGQPYFRAAIELESSTIGDGGFARPLQAGMTVVAEMTTGEQSLLAYFLKPVQHSLEHAFRER